MIWLILYVAVGLVVAGGLTEHKVRKEIALGLRIWEFDRFIITVEAILTFLFWPGAVVFELIKALIWRGR